MSGLLSKLLKVIYLLLFLCVIATTLLAEDVSAQTCESLGGRCVPFRCSQGAPLDSTDCGPFPFNCCPSEPVPDQTCADLGGYCTPLNCSQGDPLPASDCHTFPTRCCPNQPSEGQSCTELGGVCRFLLQCGYGAPINSEDCSAPGQLCCPLDPGGGDTGGQSALAGCPAQHINTAIGCIPFGDRQAFAAFFLGWGMGIGGGIAFIMIVYSGIMIITSAGNPQRVQAGKELLTAALMGLMLLVFSVFILRFIGVDILALPGF